MYSQGLCQQHGTFVYTSTAHPQCVCMCAMSCRETHFTKVLLKAAVTCPLPHLKNPTLDIVPESHHVCYVMYGNTNAHALPTKPAGCCSVLPESIMKMVLEQVGKVLANDPSGRAQFVHSGGLAAVQQMGEAPGTGLAEAVEIINSNYPEEIVKYYSPGYSQQLLQRLDAMAGTAAVAVN